MDNVDQLYVSYLKRTESSYTCVMKHPWEHDPGLKNFPFEELENFAGDTFLLGAYKYELEKYFDPKNARTIESLDQLSNLGSNPRNLIISDLATAEKVFWNCPNSRIRNIANERLLIPVCLGWLQMNWGVGFSTFESNLTDWWRWNVGDNTDGTIGLINRSKGTRRIKISFKLEHNYESKTTFSFSLDNLPLNNDQDSSGYVFEFDLKPGFNAFRIMGGHPAFRRTNADARKLNYRIINLVLNGHAPNEGEFDLFARWQLHENGYAYVKELVINGQVSVSDGFHNFPIFESVDKFAETFQSYSWYLASSIEL